MTMTTPTTMKETSVEAAAKGGVPAAADTRGEVIRADEEAAAPAEEAIEAEETPHIPVAEATPINDNDDDDKQQKEMAPPSSSNTNNKKDLYVFVTIFLFLIVILILAIVLPITLTNNNTNNEVAVVSSSSEQGREREREPEPPILPDNHVVDTTTEPPLWIEEEEEEQEQEGRTRMTYYGVNTVIDGRLATTTVQVDFNNTRIDCTTQYGLTLQLPIESRVTILQTTDNRGCQLDGIVQSKQLAQKTYEDVVAKGKPAAIVKAWDNTNYEVKVAIPPSGSTSLVLVLEELLQQRQHRINFKIPFSPPDVPGGVIDHLEMDVTVVEDPSTGGGGISDFQLVDEITPLSGGEMVVEVEDESSVKAHFEAVNVVVPDNVPQILRGSYNPGALPEDGIIYTSGNCFEHMFMFNPTSLLQLNTDNIDTTEDGPYYTDTTAHQHALARNIIFVIDVSGSMSGQKLIDTKSAFAFMIESLIDNKDTFAVQTFSNEGTKDLWGPSLATQTSKDQAVNYVYSLHADGGTNLNEAYLDAIAQANSTSSTATGGGDDMTNNKVAVPIVIFMTDGQPTAGERSPQQIARNIVAANTNGRVQIFSIAFGDDAAMDLLLGIAIQNGGLVQQIYEGFDDSKEQMQTFFNSELRTILLSNVTVNIGGDFVLTGETKPTFPVLPAGSEIIVRGLVESSGSNIQNDSLSQQVSIQASTAGMSSQGYKTWTTEAVMSVPLETEEKSSRCHQSYAHSQVTELMQYRDAARLLGDDLRDYIDFECYDSLVACIEREALSVALDAGLVWPELTSLVTVEGDKCSSSSDRVEVCYDGTGKDSQPPADEYKDYAASKHPPSPPGAAARPSRPSANIMNGGAARGKGGYTTGAATDAPVAATDAPVGYPSPPSAAIPSIPSASFMDDVAEGEIAEEEEEPDASGYLPPPATESSPSSPSESDVNGGTGGGSAEEEAADADVFQQESPADYAGGGGGEDGPAITASSSGSGTAFLTFSLWMNMLQLFVAFFAGYVGI